MIRTNLFAFLLLVFLARECGPIIIPIRIVCLVSPTEGVGSCCLLLLFLLLLVCLFLRLFLLLLLLGLLLVLLVFLTSKIPVLTIF